MKLNVAIVSAEKMLYSGEASMVIATLVNGEVGILPQHAPLLAALKPGQIRVIQGGHAGSGAESEEVFYVSGGTIEVQPNGVTVLADTAERADNLDESKAIESIHAAEKLLSETHEDFDYARARAELAHAAAQIAAIRKLKKK